MEYSSITDIGMTRSINQDRYVNYQANEMFLFVVADGMGGHNAGEVASELAVETIRGYISEHLEETDRRDLLTNAISKANRVIFENAQKDEKYYSMGTTVVAAVIEKGNCFFANVGDSRLYYFDKERLRQVTRDHSLVSDLFHAGTITAEEAERSVQKNMITRALGMDEEISVDTGEFAINEGEMLLLCTDGLTNGVSDEEIFRLLNGESVDKIAERLIEAGKEAGGFDNITVTVVRNSEVEL